MFKIEKAVSDDFERVYPLFSGFGGPPIPKAAWKKIFDSPWPAVEDFCGYLLLKDGEVKGYLGLIFSHRRIDDKPQKLGNITSWIVREDCRGQSLLLIFEALKLKDYTLTNFTASPTVAAILSKLGFKEFRVDQRVLLPVPSFSLSQRGVGCYFELQSIGSKVRGNDLKIFEDHQGLNCQHLLLESTYGDCYVVLKKTKRKSLSFAKVHYLSNAKVFHDCMEHLAAKISFRLGVFGFMVDERYIQGQKFGRSVHYPHQRAAFFKSNSAIDENQIDTIYSELVVLHD